ncbi:hypothetical protein D8674_033938 [Pyrus ussuriensis x Pyrus communis]|uniref:Uncharacterized protein n=1 Tax=Pyrus ussuriensis x Pyrus communis TaxID=2448454 RepID=A0A5N5HR14_9ROSA|nr:hypothetical protein D8674_033938 [Pyrus ussuriensis x Pyrus communis]
MPVRCTTAKTPVSELGFLSDSLPQWLSPRCSSSPKSAPSSAAKPPKQGLHRQIAPTSCECIVTVRTGFFG